MNYPCFFLNPTEFYRVYLRRYANGTCSIHGYHDTQVEIGMFTEPECLEQTGRQELTRGDLFPHEDSRWKNVCDCGYQFKESDHWQYVALQLYARADNGAVYTLKDAPVGAMWDATWHHDWPDVCGPDGRSLHVRMPGNHDWHIDGRANNCTMPTDNVHRCWIRHGEPPILTVDKNGLTCSAGAGSIVVPGWHGFLRNGVLEEC